MYDDWIWKQPNWTTFTWKDENILPLTRHIHQKIGILLGQSQHNPEKEHLTLDNLIANLVSSSAIENETLNVYSLRSSLAKRLGVSLEQPYPSSERSDGLANIMLDALNNFEQDLTVARLFQWHQWLFNETDWTMQRIRIGQLRGYEPMQVVSGRMDYPTVHFEAPPRAGLEEQLGDTATLIGGRVNVIETRAGLRQHLSTDSSDISMVMIHKFQEHKQTLTNTVAEALGTYLAMPAGKTFGVVNTSDRIILMIDEAHRTQSSDLGDNLFEAFPNATRIAFTGTPLITERHGEKKTHKRFGEYIDT